MENKYRLVEKGSRHYLELTNAVVGTVKLNVDGLLQDSVIWAELQLTTLYSQTGH